MRVITGTARGRRLKEPVGLETRPTADRVKEGIFSSIQFELEGRRVLDLFGGTGQMGIEALSRGAAHATFVDLRKEAAAIVFAHAAVSFSGRNFTLSLNAAPRSTVSATKQGRPAVCASTSTTGRPSKRLGSKKASMAS